MRLHARLLMLLLWLATFAAQARGLEIDVGVY